MLVQPTVTRETLETEFEASTRSVSFSIVLGFLSTVMY